jgi:hypothetical protein
MPQPRPRAKLNYPTGGVYEEQSLTRAKPDTTASSALENIAQFACRKLQGKHNGNLGEVFPEIAWRDYGIVDSIAQGHTPAAYCYALFCARLTIEREAVQYTFWTYEVANGFDFGRGNIRVCGLRTFAHAGVFR